jgi:NADPH:quinone reductase-like Zn-dependent oxidoreductase
LQLDAFGLPEDVARLIEVALPRPDASQVLVAMEASPIHHSDLLLIRGHYGRRPHLPAALGSEGVGRVIGVGADVDPSRVGERVLILPTLNHGTWQDRVAVEARDAVAVNAEADALQMAMLGINPVTADLLLRRFVDLAPGSWVGQTGGSSAVGRCVIALAARAGVRTLSVVRRPEVVAELRAAGGDEVLVSGPRLRADLKQALGGDRLSLVVDPLAGDSLTTLASFMTPGGTVVNYGGMSGASVTVAPSDLIFRDLTVRGFWQQRWLETAPRPEVLESVLRLGALVQDGTLHSPVSATYHLSEGNAALSRAADSAQPGKVLFVW